MFARQKYYYTHQEYLKLDGQASEKSEYYHGEIVAMAGSTLNHNTIAGNLYIDLRIALADKPCATFFGDIKVWLEERDYYTYPDVMVICGEPEFVGERTDMVTNPVVIIEVLSKSTAEYDRSDKLHASFTLASLQEYVLIDQYRMKVEYFRRKDQLWELRVFTKAEESLGLKSIGVDIPLSQIYRQVKWEEDHE